VGNQWNIEYNNASLTNTVVAEPEVSTPPIPKPATGIDPEPIQIHIQSSQHISPGLFLILSSYFLPGLSSGSFRGFPTEFMYAFL
jgi:hypothetical protein